MTLFAGCFTGLDHVYGTYNPETGENWQEKKPVTAEVMLAHLQGRQPYGVYLLTERVTRAIVADFDQDDRWPPLAFRNEALHYGLPVYIERSKKKGWHCWAFAPPQGVTAKKARLVVKMILDDIECSATEVFPRQDQLSGPRDYGNFINAPLFGKLTPLGRTVFVDPDAGFTPYSDQWDFLEGVRRITEQQLDDLIEINNLNVPEQAPLPPAMATSDVVSLKTFGLPPCAQRILRGGVTELQRVACFRLAVDLKVAGIPEDLALAILRTWAQKNRPTDGKQILTPTEIADQTRCAYQKFYRSRGCDEAAIKPYCSEDCHLHAIQTGISPATRTASSPPSLPQAKDDRQSPVSAMAGSKAT